MRSFQLLGFDFMLDAKMKAVLIEVRAFGLGMSGGSAIDQDIDADSIANLTTLEKYEILPIARPNCPLTTPPPLPRCPPLHPISSHDACSGQRQSGLPRASASRHGAGNNPNCHRPCLFHNIRSHSRFCPTPTKRTTLSGPEAGQISLTANLLYPRNRMWHPKIRNRFG